MNTPSFLSEAVLYHDYRRRDALDLSGNSNDGTIANVTFNRNGGVFNGSNSAIAVSDAASLDFGTADFTLFFLVNKNSTDWCGLMEKVAVPGPGGATTAGFEISMDNLANSATVRFGIADGSANVSSKPAGQTASAYDNKDTYIGLSVDRTAGTANLYINGVFQFLCV